MGPTREQTYLPSRTVADNIRRCRTAQKLSQTKVAENAKISRVAFRHIEEGRAAPRSETLHNIALALGVSVQDLLGDAQSARTSIRFRAHRRMVARADLLSDVNDWINRYDALELLLDEKREKPLENLRAAISRLAPDANRFSKAAELARVGFGLHRDTDTIADLCGLVEQKGIKLYTPQLASDLFFGLSVGDEKGGPAIVVNTWQRLSVERWIFSTAHELGHLLLHLNSFVVSETEENADEEREADTFASHFLMPHDAFTRELQQARGLPLDLLVLKLKRIFRVSWKTVLYRLQQTYGPDAKLWPRFRALYERRAGRSIANTEEPMGLPADTFHPTAAKAADEPDHLLLGDFVEDRLYRLVRRALDERLITVDEAANTLRVDLPTMRSIRDSWVA